MIQELKFASRSLLRAPVFSAVVVTTLALAIGAATTIYSVVSGVLLQPLPFADQDRLLMLWQRAPGVGVAEDWFSPAQYFDIKEAVGSLEHVAIVSGQEVTLTGDEIEPARLGTLRVSSSFFDVMGVAPELGRPFDGADDAAGAARKVLLSQQLFEERFGGDRSVVGRSITLDGQRLEIVGVMPAFVLDADLMPTLATVPVFDMLLSFPLADPQRTSRGSENFNIVGKLSSGAGPARLEQELLGVARMFAEDPGALGAGLAAGTEFFISAVPLLDQVVGGARPYLVVLLAATLVLLAIACANVANLLLTRAATRRQELSLRASLGAPRAHMMAQVMLEALMLSLLGAVGGLLITTGGVAALHAAAPPELPRLREIGVDGDVLAFASTLCLTSCVLFGLGPAWRASSIAPGEVLRSAAIAVRARSLWRRGGSRLLVIAQVAMSLLLVIGAGLLVRTFWQLRSVDPGFEAAGALSFRLSLAGPRYDQREARLLFYRQLFERLQSIPGMSSAGGTSLLPFTRGLAWTDFVVEGFNEDNPDARIVADVMTATPGYFAALGASMVAGRPFDDADGSGAPVAIVNRAFAERFWRVEDAVGKWIGNDFSNRMTIVGVVETVKHYGLDAEVRPAVFRPYAATGGRTLFGVVRTGDVADRPRGTVAAGTARRARQPGETPDPMAVGAAVIGAVRDLDPALPVYDVRTMDDRMARSLARQRVLMWLLNGFGVTAMALATVGLYGVLSFAVATQARELGIRKALGAQPADLYRLVLSGAGVVTGLGVGVGIGAAVWALRLLDTVVYRVRTDDPWSFGAAITLVVAVSFVASMLPARRAASVDPMLALKE